MSKPEMKKELSIKDFEKLITICERCVEAFANGQKRAGKRYLAALSSVALETVYGEEVIKWIIEEVD
jgi:hypothetical protein